MDRKPFALRCHECKEPEKDRRAYRAHLLRYHGQVSRLGQEVPVTLEPRELGIVCAGVQRHQVSGRDRDNCNRGAQGLPHRSDIESERRKKDNCKRAERRLRVAMRTLGEVSATRKRRWRSPAHAFRG